MLHSCNYGDTSWTETTIELQALKKSSKFVDMRLDEAIDKATYESKNLGLTAKAVQLEAERQSLQETAKTEKDVKQLNSEYHLSPDDDYPAFNYHKGLPYMNGFYMEVHYEGTLIQHESIRRVLSERGKTVYATAMRFGAILVNNGNVKLLGDVRVFDRQV